MLRMSAVPPCRAILARIDSEMPRRSSADGVGVEALAPVADEQRHPGRLHLDEERHRGRPRPGGGVDRRLAPGGQQGPQLVGQSAVARRRRTRRRRRWLSSTSLSMTATPWASVVTCGGVERSRRPGLEQPGPQLALLGPGQAGHLAGVARRSLDERQGLEDRVVDGGRHVGPLLGADPLAALDGEVAGQCQPPRTEHDQEPDEDDGGRGHAPRGWPRSGAGWPPGHRDRPATRTTPTTTRPTRARVVRRSGRPEQRCLLDHLTEERPSRRRTPPATPPPARRRRTRRAR